MTHTQSLPHMPFHCCLPWGSPKSARPCPSLVYNQASALQGHELAVCACACCVLLQARSYDEATQNSVLGWYLRNAQTRALSHPLPVMRAREVDRWAQGPQYKSLLARNRAHSSSAGSSSISNGGSMSGSTAGSTAGSSSSTGIQQQQVTSAGSATVNGTRTIKIM